MKNAVLEALTSKVDPIIFGFTCLLLFSLGLAATTMAEDIGLTYEQGGLIAFAPRIVPHS